MRILSPIVPATAAMLVLGQPAFAAPANTLQELFANLDACMKGVSGDPGEQLTIAFSLKRDGSLFGKPKITFSRLPRDAAARNAFLDDVATRFNACLPASITDALGGAIAGQRLTVRFVVPRHEISS
ncbi:hypothetical protein [Rhodoblastus sp.]|uniref:hypothetical protein n=1 Tax=Rhodoblastus sp. TaxID=1962975 RepID=UPI002623389B|nr:hypothetical protein [Rhodoblastus sp.]